MATNIAQLYFFRSLGFCILLDRYTRDQLLLPLTVIPTIPYPLSLAGNFSKIKKLPKQCTYLYHLISFSRPADSWLGRHDAIGLDGFVLDS
jgi:hypothetical protein